MRKTSVIIGVGLAGLFLLLLARRAQAQSATGFQWEVQHLIDTGWIPSPPEDIDLIPEAAWYWDGAEWSVKTRPGFEPQPLITEEDEGE